MRTTERRVFRRTEAGAFLVQTLVFVLLLTFIAASLTQFILARHILVHRANSAASGRLLLEGIESRVRACLDGTGFETDCKLRRAPEGCIPNVVEGRPVRVTAGGAPPLCRLEIKVEL